MRQIIGIDPGLVNTGWGIIASDGHKLEFIACGVISPDAKLPLSQRLYQIYQEFHALLSDYRPDDAALEEIFVNKNPHSALKLGAARGILLALPHLFNITVTEYHNRTVKQALSGSGQADKEQIRKMVLHLLPLAKHEIKRHDMADALALAITHAHSHKSAQKWGLL